MKKLILFFALITLCAGLMGFECNPFGPEADHIYFANFQDSPVSMGIRIGDSNKLVIQENGYFVEYVPPMINLDLVGSCLLNESTLLVAMGCGSYSDGVYNFDLNTHQWELNEWFIWPNFVKHCPENGKYYVGERDGLFESTDGTTWSRITALGSDACTSLAWHDQHMICNIGNNVFISDNAGQTWQETGMVLLEKFRFTSMGVLYGIMDDLSDSDGLWCSYDYGANWEVVFYCSCLSAVGPDYDGLIPIAWYQPFSRESFLALLNSSHELNFLNHINLDSGIYNLDGFPLVNTSSFYVLLDSECYYITNFGPVSNENQLSPDLQMHMEIFPNPARTDCSIKLKGEAEIPELINVYNLKGQLVRRIPLNGKSETQWNLLSDNGHRLPAGIYIMHMKMGSAKPLTGKLILLN
ncbi:MAG: T9SS type A sorting domain-containing protein [Candidatus Cloacimonetes bacterium]|nr:T9SS type A sorting domain-containing protein [Candidatus Cloacimonadota bacterium]